jgi:hypothetical protein
MIKVLQINTCKSRASLDLAIVTATQIGASIICITEPPALKNGKLYGTAGWNQVSNTNSTILYKPNLKKVHPISLKADYTTGIVIGECALLSVYCPPNSSVDAPFGEIRELASRHAKIVLTGDFNCRSPEFSNLPLRPRDTAFQDLQWELNLVPENDGTPTLVHQGRFTTNDYTFTRGASVTEWAVLSDEESLSDHRYISCKISTTIEKQKWYRYKLDEAMLKAEIDDCPFLGWAPNNAAEVQHKAEVLTEWLTLHGYVHLSRRNIHPCILVDRRARKAKEGN